MDDRGTVTLVRSRLRVADALLEMGRSATRELLLLPSPGMTTEGGVRLVYLALDAALDNGVRMRVAWPLEGAELLPPGVDPDESLPLHADPVALLVSDERALLVHFVPDDGDLRRGQDVALSIEQPVLANALRAYAFPEPGVGSAGVAFSDGRAPAPSPLLAEWRSGVRQMGPAATLGLLPDGALLDLLAEADLAPDHRRLVASALRRRIETSGRSAGVPPP